MTCSGSQRNEFLWASGDKQSRVLRWSLTIWGTACVTMDACNRGTALLAFPLIWQETYRNGQSSLILTASSSCDSWGAGNGYCMLGMSHPGLQLLLMILRGITCCQTWRRWTLLLDGFALHSSWVRTSTEVWRGRIVFPVWKINLGLYTRVRPQKL